jgi:hypothetical protein
LVVRRRPRRCAAHAAGEVDSPGSRSPGRVADGKGRRVGDYSRRNPTQGSQTEITRHTGDRRGRSRGDCPRRGEIFLSLPVGQTEITPEGRFDCIYGDCFLVESDTILFAIRKCWVCSRICFLKSFFTTKQII